MTEANLDECYEATLLYRFSMVAMKRKAFGLLFPLKLFCVYSAETDGLLRTKIVEVAGVNFIITANKLPNTKVALLSQPHTHFGSQFRIMQLSYVKQ